MTQQAPHPHPMNFLKALRQRIAIEPSIRLIGGLSIFASSAIAIPTDATTNSFVIMDAPGQSAPAPSPSAPIAPPVPVKPVQAPPPKVSAPVATPPKAAAPVATTTPPPKVQLSAPKLSVPSDEPREISPIVPQTSLTEIQKTPVVVQPRKNQYVDTNSYTASTPKTPIAPSAVVLTERSTGCSTVSQNGQLSSGTCGKTPQKTPVLAAKKPLRPTQLVASSQTKRVEKLQPVRLKSRPVSPNQVIPLNLGANNSLGLALAPIPQYNRATVMRPQSQPDNRRTSLIFPLSMPAKITSAFGWRVHPITGTGRMHSGTDLGAPIGTPVLAAYPGEVATADWLGGYGLTVILRHENGTQESRYAHLSEIFVQPKQWVEQGTVIGRVGNTGMSTGPHLHFEWRHLTKEGWVAVDAGLHLEYALENLMRYRQIADSTVKPNG